MLGEEEVAQLSCKPIFSEIESRALLLMIDEHICLDNLLVFRDNACKSDDNSEYKHHQHDDHSPQPLMVLACVCRCILFAAPSEGIYFPG